MINRLLRFLHKIIDIYLHFGPKGVLKHLYYAATGKMPKPNPIDPYKFVLSPNHGEMLKQSSKKVKGLEAIPTLNWFMMDMGTNGGGDINIFRYINGLAAEGFNNRVYIAYECKHKTRKELTEFVTKHYGKVDAEFFLPEAEIKPAAAAIATEWRTAYLVKELNNVREKFYFVQDYEPSFFPDSSAHELAKNTYTFGFKGITAGYWLQDKLKQEFGMKTFGFTFSYDKDLYRNIESIQPKQKRIFFYARPVTPRRAFELGILALKQLYELDNGVEVVLAGWDTSEMEIPFPHKNLGLQKIQNLPEIYNSCELGLVLSLTNCSLLPTELLACGCVPVINSGDNNEWLVKDGKNGIVVSTQPTEIAEKIKDYLDHPQKVAKIRTTGIKMLTETSNQEQFKKVADFIRKQL